MRKKLLLLCTAIGFLTGTASHGEEAVFTNQGLDTEWVVTLNVQADKVSGHFRSHGYDGENIVEKKFTGEVLDSSSKNQKKLAIKFKGDIPYDAPDEKIVWKLKNATLLIPIMGRNFDTVPPTLTKYDMELEKLPSNYEGD